MEQIFINLTTKKATCNKSKEAKKRNRRDTALSFFAGASTTFIAWLFLSWLDVVLHNMDPEPVYRAWNFFALFFM